MEKRCGREFPEIEIKQGMRRAKGECKRGGTCREGRNRGGEKGKDENKKRARIKGRRKVKDWGEEGVGEQGREQGERSGPGEDKGRLGVKI